MSANDKGDNEMIPGLCTDLWTFALKETTYARRPLMKALRPIIASNGVSYLQMRSLGSHSTSEMEKERKDGLGITMMH